MKTAKRSAQPTTIATEIAPLRFYWLHGFDADGEIMSANQTRDLANCGHLARSMAELNPKITDVAVVDHFGSLLEVWTVAEGSS